MTLELYTKRLRAASQVALMISDIENMRGKSHRIVDIIAPLSEVDALYVYRMEPDFIYNIVSSWSKSEVLDCSFQSRVFRKDDIFPQILDSMLKRECVYIGDVSSDNTYDFIPVISNHLTHSVLVYPIPATGEIMGIIVFVSYTHKKWSDATREWLDMISSMLTGAIRRTLTNETLAYELKFRDTIYPIIAHDLRSSIGSLHMILDMLVGSTVLDEKDREQLLLMASGGARESFVMLDNMLKWTRERVGKVHPVITPLNISQIIDSVTIMLGAMAENKGVALKVELLDDNLMVNSDSDMLTTVIRNLLSNAIKFTGAGGSVSIVFERDNNTRTWSVAVKDTGVGISQLDIAKLINENVHFTTYGTSGEKGSGLGFTVIQNFVRLMGGRIDIHSIEREGSVFRVVMCDKNGDN